MQITYNIDLEDTNFTLTYSRNYHDWENIALAMVFGRDDVSVTSGDVGSEGVLDVAHGEGKVTEELSVAGMEKLERMKRGLRRLTKATFIE